METDEKRRGKDAAAALSGGHLCHVCGYQYPNPHPSAKLRRSHRKHCGKAPAPEPAAAVEEEEEAVAGLRKGEREERNAVEGTLLGGVGGGVGAGNGASEANGGSAFRGSAREVGESIDDKQIAEHASSNSIGVQRFTSEFSENGQINCINSEKVTHDNTGVQVINRGFSTNGLVDCSSNSELLTEGNGTELLTACTIGLQNEVGKHCSGIASVRLINPAEREDSFDEYQDTSPFLHQSDSEDGAVPSSDFSIEINNLNTVLPGSSVAANEISLEADGLCKDQVSRQSNLTDLSAETKVQNISKNGTLSLAGSEGSLKLVDPYESSVNVGCDHTYMVDNKSDKISCHNELVGDSNASSLQEIHSVVLDPESQSTCSTKVQGIMEGGMHALHNMYEAPPRPEAAESNNVELETITDFSSNTMPIGNELKVVHTGNNPTVSSTELPSQKWPVKDTSDVHLPVENYCQEQLCSTAGFQNIHAATNVDDTLNSITKGSFSDMDFTFEARTHPDIVKQINVAEEKQSVQKTNEFIEEEVCNKQIGPEVPTEDQFPKSQTHAKLPMESCVKNPFDLDDARNDDLFELSTDSCYLEVPSAAVSRQEVGCTSLIVDQLTISNRAKMAEVQHNHDSKECILSASNSSENGRPVGPEDMPVSSSAELVKNTCLASPVDHGMQEDQAHTNGIPFVPSQLAPMEFSTVHAQDTNALSTGVEENTQIVDATAMETVVHTTNDIEMKHADDTTATDSYTINVEAKNLPEDNAAKTNEVQHNHVEEKHAGSTKEVSAVHSMRAEDTDTKEMNAMVNADVVEGKQQTDDTSSEKKNAIGWTDNFEENLCAQVTKANEMTAAQSTEKVEENKQPNTTVGQQGNNQKEEIAVTGGRLNSGRIHVPLKVLLAEASAENKVKKPSAKERVLSFRRRVSKDGNSPVKSGSPKSGSDDHHWHAPAKLPRRDADKSSRGRKQLWMPFICCHSVR